MRLNTGCKMGCQQSSFFISEKVKPNLISKSPNPSYMPTWYICTILHKNSNLFKITGLFSIEKENKTQSWQKQQKYDAKKRKKKRRFRVWTILTMVVRDVWGVITDFELGLGRGERAAKGSN